MDLKEKYKNKVKKIDKADDGYIIYVSKNKYHLKKTKLSESEILFINEVIEYAKKNGFKNVVSFEKFSDGKPYLKYDGDMYILIDDLYEDVSINKFSNALCCVELLAQFHSSTRGYRASSGIKPNVAWGKRAEKYKNLYRILEKYIDEVKDKEKQNEFEKYTMKYIDEIKDRCKKSIKTIRSMEYIKILEDSMKNKEIILYDIPKDCLKNKKDTYFINNIYHISYGLYEEDLAMLIKKSTFNAEFIDKLIEGYKKNINRKISLDLVNAFLFFPENTLKVIRTYMMERDGKLINKFRRALKKDGLGVNWWSINLETKCIFLLIC